MDDAAAACCKFGMRLASLETAAEYLCVISNELGEFCKTNIVFKSKILSCGALQLFSLNVHNIQPKFSRYIFFKKKVKRNFYMDKMY
jgi:hypothetical protein